MKTLREIEWSGEQTFEDLMEYGLKPLSGFLKFLSENVKTVKQQSRFIIHPKSHLKKDWVMLKKYVLRRMSGHSIHLLP